MADITVEPTPNPNSMKFTAQGAPFIESGMETFSTAEEAGDHPLGSKLFALGGVANVFILPQFLTVTKAPAADWDTLLPMIESALETYFSEQS